MSQLSAVKDWGGLVGDDGSRSRAVEEFVATIMHVSAIAEVGGIHQARQKCECGQQSIPATPK